MTVPITSVLDAVVSHALASGVFERVNGHEPKNAPGNGLTAAVWVERIVPQIGSSGLNATTARVEFKLRLYSNMLQEPQDDIDPNLVNALDVLFTAYSGDFDLGGSVRNVDLLGQEGVGLQAQAGYLNQDSRLFRVFDITLPVIINDTWTQAA